MKNHKCNFCGKEFYSKDSFEVHIHRMHVLEGEPKLKCQQCDKTFKLKEYLDRHKKNICT